VILVLNFPIMSSIHSRDPHEEIRNLNRTGSVVTPHRVRPYNAAMGPPYALQSLAILTLTDAEFTLPVNGTFLGRPSGSASERVYVLLSLVAVSWQVFGGTLVP
jgi:hypothetical protein